MQHVQQRLLPAVRCFFREQTNFTFAASRIDRENAACHHGVDRGIAYVRFEPDAGNDGIGFIGWKVTNPSAGVWHYEYAVYNENLDRGIQSFSVPIGSGVVVSNIGFHAPPQEPGCANDGTVGNAGFSSTPWTSSVSGGTITWNCETFATNPERKRDPLGHSL